MRKSIARGIAAVAMLAITAAPDTAFAQAGSTGGSIGKQDKSISGGEEENKPSAAIHSKQPAGSVKNTPSDHPCSAVVGTWSWYLGVTEMTFSEGGTWRSSSGITGPWNCIGPRTAVAISEGSKSQYVIAQDGKTMFVTSTWGGGITFTATRK
jgi:hypothetical protein